jgi:hypothetical protein
MAVIYMHFTVQWHAVRCLCLWRVLPDDGRYDQPKHGGVHKVNVQYLVIKTGNVKQLHGTCIIWRVYSLIYLHVRISRGVAESSSFSAIIIPGRQFYFLSQACWLLKLSIIRTKSTLFLLRPELYFSHPVFPFTFNIIRKKGYPGFSIIRPYCK